MARKYLGIIIFVILLCFSGVCSAWFINIVKDEGLKLRAGPGENYGAVMEAIKSDPLKVVGQQGQWYKVIHWTGRSGWVHKPYAANRRTLVVKARVREVNLRSGPGTRYSKITGLFQGAVLKPLKKQGRWIKVEVVDPPEGGTGWVHKSLVWGI